MVKIKENIKKMADLLRSGHTMLNIACPICNNPVFRKKDGKVLCPTCNREVKLIDNKEIEIKSINKNQNSQNNIDKKKLDTYNSRVLNELKQVFLEKISVFTEKLKSETQIAIIEKYLDLLSTIYDLLNKFSDLDI